MQPTAIKALIELAVTAYLKHSPPGEYAKTAAHKAAVLAASRHHTEIADFAALTAAAAFYVEVTEAIGFSTRVTDAASGKLLSDSAYKAEWQEYSATILPAQTTQKRFFQSLSEVPDKAIHDFTASVTPTFEKIRVQDVAARNRAKRAAMYVYRDTYTVSRAAYVRAMHAAVQAKDEHKRLKIFQTSISKQLHQSLSFDMIHPSFFLIILQSTPLRIAALVLLLAGIGAIVVGVLHVIPLPVIPLIIAGSGTCTLSLCIGFGSFFAKRKLLEIADRNDRFEEVCGSI